MGHILALLGRHYRWILIINDKEGLGKRNSGCGCQDCGLVLFRETFFVSVFLVECKKMKSTYGLWIIFDLLQLANSHKVQIVLLLLLQASLY